MVVDFTAPSTPMLSCSEQHGQAPAATGTGQSQAALSEHGQDQA